MNNTKQLIKELRAGHYNEWAKGYIEDLNAPNTISEDDMEIEPLLNVVIDFLESRLIEAEEENKQNCPHDKPYFDYGAKCGKCGEQMP